MKTAFVIAARIIALTLMLFVCFSVVGTFIGLQDSPQHPEPPSSVAMALLAVSFLITVVVSHIILRSRWTGWQLIGAVFIVLYGVMTFMAQIESLVFLTHLPPGVLPRLFLMGGLVAAPFAVVAVFVLGRGKSSVAGIEPSACLKMSAKTWAWKLGVIALAYVILYFVFGYFIAWRNPVVREFYDGIDEGSFFTHMSAVVRDVPWLVPFQILRAMLWTVIALPVIRMMKGEWQETALAVGLLFSVVMNSQLLLPNPYMPEAVRMTHLLETASSNLIFGFLVGGLLAQRHRRAEGGAR